MSQGLVFLTSLPSFLLSFFFQIYNTNEGAPVTENKFLTQQLNGLIVWDWGLPHHKPPQWEKAVLGECGCVYREIPSQVARSFLGLSAMYPRSYGAIRKTVVSDDLVAVQENYKINSRL